jgi:hypothetical protein
MDINKAAGILRSGGKIPLIHGGEEYYLSGKKKPAWYGKDNISVNGLTVDDLYIALAEENKDMKLMKKNGDGFAKAFKEECKRVDREISEIATEKKRADKRITERRKRLVAYLVRSGIEPVKILAGKIDIGNVVDMVEDDRGLRARYGSNGRGYSPEYILAPVKGDLRYIRKNYGKYFRIRVK